jgi:DNA-binding transcriptional LysR family regulator
VRVARLGSFSGAARELGVAPSVITKRVGQLEKSVGGPLIVRSTRGLTLTTAGERLLPRFVRLVAEFEEIFAEGRSSEQRIEGHLRIKSPTTLTTEYLGGVYADFAVAHPGVNLDVILMDRSVNPLEESFDVCIGALPVSYPNVVDVPLCPYDLVTCCAPGYLKGKEKPTHPTQLVDYECLTTTLFRTTWVYESSRGALSVEVHSRVHSADARVVREAVRRGLGVAVMARFLVNDDIKAGRLVPLLEDFPLATHWIKALVPRIRMSKPAVRELVGFITSRMQSAPWIDSPPSKPKRS